jgi:tetratricopeptide (TPR) repeat protein
MVMGYYWLGIAYYHRAEYTKSRQAFEVLLEKNSESHIAHYHAALACMADQAYDKARDHLEALAGQGHKDPRIYLYLGKVYYRLNKMSDSISSYRRGLVLNPGNRPLSEALDYLTHVDDP